MVTLPWLWLNEAALIVAERLASDRSQDSDFASSLDNARKELLGWAHRGSLEIQGKYWSLPEAAVGPGYLDDKDWISLKSSLWEPSRLAHFTGPAPLPASPLPEHQRDEGNLASGGDITDFDALLSKSQNGLEIKLYDIVVDWDLNTLTFEDRGDDPEHVYEPYGYCDLRVRAGEIDHIILPQTQDQTRSIDAGKQSGPIATPLSKNPGGAPRKFADDLFIEIIKVANGIDGLPEDKSDLVRQLRKYNDPSWGQNIPSESTITRIVTIVYKRVFPQKL